MAFSIKRAALITATSKYINIFMGVGFSAILARILTPHDYGVVAIVSVFTSFFTVLANCGFGIAVIQNKDFGQREIDSLFTFSFVQGIILALAFLITGIPISLFYQENAYRAICAVLSISVLFNTINAVPDGLLRKEKKFLLIGIRLLAVSFLTYGGTIILALLGASYYALVFQSVISSVLIFGWNLKNVHVHLVRHPDVSVLKRIRGYSGYQFLFNFVNFFSRNLDKLMIGKVLGNEELAQYNKAYHFMLYPVQNLTNVISPVLHPIFSEYQNDHERMYRKYLEIVKLLSLLGAFILPVCFGCSKEIILILYGSQWNSAVLCFHYLSLAIWAQMIGGTSGAMFTSLGDTRRMFWTNCANTAIILIAVLASIHGGIVTVSIAISIALNLHFFVTFGTMMHATMQRSFLKFCVQLLPDVCIMAVLLGVSCLLNGIITIDTLFLSACVKGILLAIAYLLLLVVTRQGKYFVPLLPKRWQARFHR